MLFRKTSKGQTEIETRAHRLGPRLRGLLILVDGKRDEAALAALVPAPQGAASLLAELVSQGFVEALPAAAATPALPLHQPPPHPQPLLRPAADVAPVVLGGDDFDAVRRSAVRALNDELGPAAETLAIRIERARSMAELRPLLVQAAHTVANMRGRAAAEAYAARFLVE